MIKTREHRADGKHPTDSGEHWLRDLTRHLLIDFKVYPNNSILLFIERTSKWHISEPVHGRVARCM